MGNTSLKHSSGENVTSHQKTLTQIIPSEVRIADVDMQSPWKFTFSAKLNLDGDSRELCPNLYFGGESLVLWK